MLLIPDSVIPCFRGNSAGRDFEQVVKDRFDDESKKGKVLIVRSGVKASVVGRNKDGTAVARLQKSRVDFDGLLPSGRAFDFDCKVCSGSSFPLNQYREDIGIKSKTNQIIYMFGRAKYRSIAGFLIHWNERIMKTAEHPPATYWFPVDRRIRFWRAWGSMDVNSINRRDCEIYGYRVSWTKRKLERTFRPDVLSVLKHLDG